MSTIAFHEGLNVIEVPIRYDERVGQSKLTPFHDGIRFLNAILGLAETYNPLKFFGLAGLLLLSLGALLGIHSVAYYIQYRRVPLSEIYRLLTILVLAANYLISLVRGRSQPETLLSKLFHPRLRKWLSLIGLLSMGSAVLLNAGAIYRYVTTFHVGTHWSYILTGAFLFLVGAHLVMISRLIRVFDLLRGNQGLERAGSSQRLFPGLPDKSSGRAGGGAAGPSPVAERSAAGQMHRGELGDPAKARTHPWQADGGD